MARLDDLSRGRATNLGMVVRLPIAGTCERGECKEPTKFAFEILTTDVGDDGEHIEMTLILCPAHIAGMLEYSETLTSLERYDA